MSTRIYRVFSTATGNDWLVRATNQAQAIRYIARDQYRAAVAGQETIIELLQRGDQVLDAIQDKPETEVA